MIVEKFSLTVSVVDLVDQVSWIVKLFELLVQVYEGGLYTAEVQVLDWVLALLEYVFVLLVHLLNVENIALLEFKSGFC